MEAESANYLIVAWSNEMWIETTKLGSQYELCFFYAPLLH